MRFRVEIVFGMKNISERPDVAEVSGKTLRIVDVSGEPPGSLDTCHHLGVGQILTTTDTPRFLTCQSLRKGSRGA